MYEQEKQIQETSRVAEKAIYNFVEDSYNCSEAVLASFSEQKGLHPQTYTALATGFGGGIGSLGHMCGAISGGLMAMGLVGAERGFTRTEIRERAQRLYRGFEETFSTVSCKELTQHDCNASGGGDFDLRNCAKYLKYVSENVEEMVR